MRGLVGVLVVLVAGAMLSGCAAVAVVDTAVSVTSTVVGTTVDVAGSAISAVVGSSKDEDEIDCDDEDNKEEDVCKKKREQATHKQKQD